MTHFSSNRRNSKEIRSLIISLAVFAVIIIAFFAALHSVSAGSQRRQRENLEKAIDRCITYCYAVEGSYPEGLDHMKKNYGFAYDEEMFFVDYRYLGANMLPDVTIIELEG